MYPPGPTHIQPPPLLKSPTEVAYLLQLMNLNWHIMSTRSLRFPQGSLLLYVLWVLPNVQWHIPIMKVMQSGSTAVITPCAPPRHPFPP